MAGISHSERSEESLKHMTIHTLESGRLFSPIEAWAMSISMETFRCLGFSGSRLAVQDSNVSFGSVIDSNLFSLSIYEIKKCILFQLQVLFPVVNALTLLFWDHTETSH